MMEKNKENLKRAVDGLKNYEAPDIWSEIDEKLSTDEEAGREYLTEAVKGMKELSAPDVWDQIENQLSTDEPGQKHSSRIIWSAAASVVILITAFLIFNELEPDAELHTSSVYTTEEVAIFEVHALDNDFGNSDDGVLRYVNKNCRLMLTKCENPEFKGLYDTYLELAEAREELKGKLNETSNKEQLYKYLIRLEKDQAEVGKNLLKMLRYS